MAQILPFHGVLYDPSVVGSIADVVAPPYDVITPAAQQASHARHPYNVIRLELGLDQPHDGPGENRYTRAAASLQDWLRRGVLRRDPIAAIYPYTIEYRSPAVPGHEAQQLRGFLALATLEEFDTGRIYPHENTRAAATADRLELLQARRAHFSPIFALFSDPHGGVLDLLHKSVNAEQARLDITDDAGHRHRLWSVTDPTVLQEMSAAVGPKPLFIADGHHRYETALAYRRARLGQEPRQRQAGLHPEDLVLMLFSSLEEPGLTILPTHRLLQGRIDGAEAVLRRLETAFEVHTFPAQGAADPQGRAEFLRTLQVHGESRQVFGLALPDRPYIMLTRKPTAHLPLGDDAQDQLDVSILHRVILPALRSGPPEELAIDYTKDAQEAVEQVERGAAGAALLLNPTKVSEVQAVAASGGRMPHKSTYFYPKPLTGLVMNVMEEG